MRETQPIDMIGLSIVCSLKNAFWSHKFRYRYDIWRDCDLAENNSIVGPTKGLRHLTEPFVIHKLTYPSTHWRALINYYWLFSPDFNKVLDRRDRLSKFSKSAWQVRGCFVYLPSAVLCCAFSAPLLDTAQSKQTARTKRNTAESEHQLPVSCKNFIFS
jgi:hypothetical protein